MKFAGQSYFKDDGSRTDGAGDGAQRLREQDEDGLDAELLFVPVFASRFLEEIPDHDAYLAMVRAYNDWLVDYCDRARPSHRQRADAHLGHRRRARGARTCRRDGVQVGAAPQLTQRRQGPKPEDDQFWAKALELEMALSPHMSFAGVMNIGGPVTTRHSGPQKPG